MISRSQEFGVLLVGVWFGGRPAIINFWGRPDPQIVDFRSAPKPAPAEDTQRLGTQILGSGFLLRRAAPPDAIPRCGGRTGRPTGEKHRRSRSLDAGQSGICIYKCISPGPETSKCTTSSGPRPAFSFSGAAPPRHPGEGSGQHSARDLVNLLGPAMRTWDPMGPRHEALVDDGAPKEPLRRDTVPRRV